MDEVGAVESDSGAEGVQRLSPDMSGRWRVFTKRTVHVWDLDRGTYVRLPGAGSSAFDWDGVEAPILTVRVWPALGEPFFLFFRDPRNLVMEQWRISSPVRRIEPDE